MLAGRLQKIQVSKQGEIDLKSLKKKKDARKKKLIGAPYESLLLKNMSRQKMYSAIFCSSMIMMLLNMMFYPSYIPSSKQTSLSKPSSQLNLFKK